MCPYNTNVIDEIYIYMFAKEKYATFISSSKGGCLQERADSKNINIGSFFLIIPFIFVCLEKLCREKPVCKLIQWSLKGLLQYSWVSDKQIIQLCLQTAGITAGWTRDQLVLVRRAIDFYWRARNATLVQTAYSSTENHSGYGTLQDSIAAAAVLCGTVVHFCNICDLQGR